MKTKYNSGVIFMIFCFILTAGQLQATEPFVFSGIRSLGMGGVGVAIPNLESILYSNPAGLAFVDNNYWDLFSLSLMLDAKTLDMAKNIGRHFNRLQNKFEKMMAIAALAENSNGHLSLGAQLGLVPVPVLNYVSRNYGYGAFAQGYSEVKINNNPGPQISVEGSYEAAAIYGYGLALTKELAVGINLKYLARLGTYNKHTQSRIYQLSDKNLFEGNYNINGILGYGPAVDVGALAIIKSDWGQNYLGLTAYNIYGKIMGSTTSASQFIDNFFDIGDYLPEPSEKYNEKVPTTVIAGLTTIFSMEPIKDWLASIEYPVTRRKEGLKNIKFGVEKSLNEKGPVIRAGFNQGAYCVGASVYLGKDVRLDYAYNMDPDKNYFWHAFEVKIISKEYPLSIDTPSGTIRNF